MNKNKRLFKNNVQMVIYLIIAFLIIWAFIYLGKQNFKTDVKDDHEKFNIDYSLVDGNNVFEYANSSVVRLMLNKGEGIIFFGTNKSNWVNHYAKILNDVALSTGVNKIYYYDFLEDRNNNNGTYESIVEKLSEYVTINDMGIKDIYAPTLVIIKNDKVLLFDDETSFIKGTATPSEYWTSERVSEKTQELSEKMLEFLGVGYGE